MAALGLRKVHYTIDTAGRAERQRGELIKDGVRTGVAVHAYGGSSSKAGCITKPGYDNFQLWKAAPAGGPVTRP